MVNTLRVEIRWPGGWRRRWELLLAVLVAVAPGSRSGALATRSGALVFLAMVVTAPAVGSGIRDHGIRIR
jgi:hypothetical protein